ncbi:MAG: RdgB/HAM1 family non-canonical purine NTP pyrophosphatase [Verrucomicrobia bacterium]|nr:RdgB/HAM1 family non-canonical purine NTP pyrophosphatase [Verrucomicrobiota bacterium]
MQLVLATSNLHKILELKAILKDRLEGVELFSLKDFPNYVAPEENGKTFLENAEIKAMHAAATLKMYALADDSGLVVPALNGEPGIFSRRYASDKATDKENRDKLVAKLKLLSEEARMGYYECALSFASPEKILKTALGVCEGTLILEARGGSGFGYDPLFLKHDYNRTMAELGEDIKNRISHRRKAFDKLLPIFEAQRSLLTSS